MSDACGIETTRGNRMQLHTNMFGQYDSLHEAYPGLLKDQKDDTRKYRASLAIGGILLGLAIYYPHTPQTFGFLLLAGIFSLLQAVVHFVDMSNRNFMLHLIDYMHAQSIQRRN
jgi:hypothetical protein